jgi:hypothetical protein
MALTYLQLKTAIQDYTENNEVTFVNNLPLFIRQAEERILKNVQLNLFRKNATASMTANNQYLRIPDDFLAPFSLSWSNTDNEIFYVDYKDVSFLRDYQNDTDDAGQPRYYAQFDNINFILSPKPDSAYTVQLSYFYRPQSITAGVDSATTWLSENAEMSLLYGSLVEAATFMKSEPDVIQQYTARFQDSMLGLKMLGEAKQTTDEYRMGKVVRQKQ